MSRYQKLFTAAILFCLSVYGFFGAVWHWRFGSVMEAKIIFGCIAVGVFVIHQLLLSAEGTALYDNAHRRWRENVALRRALGAYARGLDDGGKHAYDVLSRLPALQDKPNLSGVPALQEVRKETGVDPIIRTGYNRSDLST